MKPLRSAACCSSLPARRGRSASVRRTRARAIEFYAHPPAGRDAGYVTIAAKLYLREDGAWCSERLQQLLAPGPSGDMFWMFPVTAVAYLDRGQLTAEARRALRSSWKTYMPYRGDTENHWLMYYASLYLMAQLWPDEPGTEWYTGKSSAENLREAEGVDRIVGEAHHHARPGRIRFAALYGACS